jgi:hypothetical protein
VLYAATIYVLLARIIRSTHAEYLSIVRPSRLAKIFVWCDFIALNVQGNAVGLTVKDKLEKIGQGIVIAGLAFQVLTFAGFLVVAVTWHCRMHDRGVGDEVSTPENQQQSEDVPWRQGLWVIYGCSTLVVLRSLFRVAEYAMGENGYLMAHEWYVASRPIAVVLREKLTQRCRPAYALDAIPMVIVQAIFVIWFPSQFKIAERSENVDRKRRNLLVRVGCWCTRWLFLGVVIGYLQRARHRDHDRMKSKSDDGHELVATQTAL